MTTLGVYASKVRDRLDEATERFWEDDQIRTWIMEGARDVARRAEVLQKESSIPVAIGDQVYPMPPDTIRIHRVEHHHNDGRATVLTYRDYHTMDSIWWTSQTSATGDPVFFTFWGYPPALNMTIYPKPNTGDGSFRVFYYGMPTALAADGTADGSEVELPMGWDDCVELYCEYTALRKDRDPAWQEAKQLYEQKVQELIDVTRRWSDQAGQWDVDGAFGPMDWLYGGEW